MGQGVFQGLPLSLAGVDRIMKQMDWGEAAEFVTFGAVGAEHVDDTTDVYLVIAPQNTVGVSIIEPLKAMTEAAVGKRRPICLINPNLKDRPSAGGVMSVRGRAERMGFTGTFEDAYHFRLLYTSGSFYPIRGALSYTDGGKWQVLRRKNKSGQVPNEEYVLIGEFDEEPDSGLITDCFAKAYDADR